MSAIAQFGLFEEAFREFVDNVPFYGFSVMCIDHPEVQALIGRIRDRQLITYGRSPQADVRLTDLDYVDGESRFTVTISDRRSGTAHVISDLRLVMPGDHNALNAAGAIAVAHELGEGVEELVLEAGEEAAVDVRRPRGIEGPRVALPFRDRRRRVRLMIEEFARSYG